MIEFSQSKAFGTNDVFLSVRITRLSLYRRSGELFVMQQNEEIEFFRLFLSAAFIMSAPSKYSYFFLFLPCQSWMFLANICTSRFFIMCSMIAGGTFNLTMALWTRYQSRPGLRASGFFSTAPIRASSCWMILASPGKRCNTHLLILMLVCRAYPTKSIAPYGGQATAFSLLWPILTFQYIYII